MHDSLFSPAVSWWMYKLCLQLFHFFFFSRCLRCLSCVSRHAGLLLITARGHTYRPDGHNRERERTAHGQTLPPTLSTLGKDLPSSNTTHTHTQKEHKEHKETFSLQITSNSYFFVPRYEISLLNYAQQRTCFASGNTSHMI